MAMRLVEVILLQGLSLHTDHAIKLLTSEDLIIVLEESL